MAFPTLFYFDSPRLTIIELRKKPSGDIRLAIDLVRFELADAAFHARVVTALLSEVVTVGEIEDIRAQLPPDFAKLFEVENEGEVPEIGEIVDVEE